MKKFISGIVVALVTSTGCASAPASLGPAAHAAFNNTRVIRSLTLLRNTAEAAEVEGIFSRNATRCTVQFHESSVKIIDATMSGWQKAVLVGLDEAFKNCYVDRERTLLAPYVTLARVLISEVQ